MSRSVCFSVKIQHVNSTSLDWVGHSGLPKFISKRAISHFEFDTNFWLDWIMVSHCKHENSWFQWYKRIQIYYFVHVFFYHRSTFLWGWPCADVKNYMTSIDIEARSFLVLFPLYVLWCKLRYFYVGFIFVFSASAQLHWRNVLCPSWSCSTLSTPYDIYN